MYCTRCGAINDEDSIFCINCGTDLQKKNIQKTVKIAISIIIIAALVSALFIFLPKNKDISILSTPSGADTYIDNASIGNTPITVKLPVGNYSLKINLTGYKVIEKNFNVTPDITRKEINATLEPIGRYVKSR